MTDADRQTEALRQRADMLFRAHIYFEARQLYAELTQGTDATWRDWNMFGVIHGILGDYASAERCLHEAVSRNEMAPDAYANLGNVCRHAGRPVDAERWYREALRRDPANPETLNNLANMLRERGERDEAERMLSTAIRIRPDYAGAWNSLGVLAFAARDYDKALSCFDRAVKLAPALAESHQNRGDVFLTRNELSAAISAYETATLSAPTLANAWGKLGDIAIRFGRPHAAVEYYRKALAIQPDLCAVATNLSFVSNYDPELSPAERAALHREAGRMITRSAGSGTRTRIETHDEPDRRLRIGYLSPDFKDHPVAMFMEPLLRHHDHARFEVICFSNVKKTDAVTARLKTYSSAWHDCVGRTDSEVADLIARARIDILVDLSGHTAHNRLGVFARRAAPVQCAYLGYCNTTGLDAVQYRITDPVVDPPGVADVHYMERLVRIPAPFCSFEPPGNAPLPEPGPATYGHAITFGSLNTPAKLNAQVCALWARVLHAVPGSRLFVANDGLVPDTIRYLRERFAALGIGAERVDLRSNVWDTGSHLSLYRHMDIALDPFPWNGHVTSCDALWMGVPVVTLAGPAFPARTGAMLLQCLDLGDLVAGTHDEYVSIASQLARNSSRLKELRASLRSRMAASALCDGAALARKVESAYREMWGHAAANSVPSQPAI